MSTNTANELTAVTKLSENLLTATSQIMSVYQQSNIALKSEDIIGLYCQFLVFIVDQRITGNKVHLYQLIIESIKENTNHGIYLYKTITQHTAKDKDSIQNLVKKYGLVVIPALKLAQFVNDVAIKTMQDSSSEENILSAEKIKASMLEIFDLTYHSTLQEINALDIANPLIFLLEHFSNTIGWLVGFFAALKQQSVQEYLEKSLTYFKQAIQLECIDKQKIH